MSSRYSCRLLRVSPWAGVEELWGAVTQEGGFPSSNKNAKETQSQTASLLHGSVPTYSQQRSGVVLTANNHGKYMFHSISQNLESRGPWMCE